MAICPVCHHESYGAFCSGCGAPLSLSDQQPDSGETSLRSSRQAGPSGWVAPHSEMPHGQSPYDQTSADASSTRQSLTAAPGTSSGKSIAIPRFAFIGGAVVLVAALGIAFAVGQSRSVSRSAVPSYSQPASTYAPATTSAPTTTSTISGTSDISGTAGPLSESSAKLWLESESVSYSVTTDGHYLVQLSAKYYGVIDPHQIAANGSHTFSYADIVSDYEGYRARYGSDIHLVRSTQFGKQSTNPDIPAGEPLYLTIYDPGTFSSKDAADAWCESTFPSLSGSVLDNACLARSASAPHG